MVKTILIADDEEDIREVIKDLLDVSLPQGVYSYEFFKNGEELDARLSDGNLEGVVVVSTDNDMKIGLKGGEIITKHAGRLKGSVGFFLYYGAMDRDSIGKKALQDGAISFQKKPMNASLYVLDIKEYLERKSK